MPNIITSAEVKAWCRIDDDADDAVLDLLIETAQEQAAAYTNTVLDAATCPSGIKQAVAVFVADLYANREGQMVGTQTFYRLLNQHRLTVL
ncbi:head-tail connector protein [Microvirga sp. SRT01]|uniref:Phage gp6-like head-tail connector protein n=1 Tax=Sphingomonas longa TaxID=2778730 RepID=A0ABS2D879_9SPHN|nr:phage gp6-like head-tail connector protein [Sphingomonas sp. BT552]MBR7710164.1 head-tail connector protein [Microvirga sp. SRT01]